MEKIPVANEIVESDIKFDSVPIGSGAFGKVYKGIYTKTGETVAVKKVFQDSRYKNRELQIMLELNHQNIVRLIAYYYTKGRNDLYLNCVMEYVPITLSDLISKNAKENKQFPPIVLKIFIFQMLKSIGYLHSLGICHRDIKPQNIMIDLNDYSLKLCDFGCAKRLIKGEDNVAYICSRHYRPPELVLGATQYTTKTDVWSMGCVIAELVLNDTLFQGKSAKDQFTVIIKVLGTPTKTDIHAMNPNQKGSLRIPKIPHKNWNDVFKNKNPDPLFIDLIDKIFVYDPEKRPTPFEAMCHPYFNDLKKKDTVLPNGEPIPSKIFEFSEVEKKDNSEIISKILQESTKKDNNY